MQVLIARENRMKIVRMREGRLQVIFLGEIVFNAQQKLPKIHGMLGLKGVEQKELCGQHNFFA